VSTVAEEVVEALEVADGETPMGEGLDGLGMGPGGGPIGPMGPTAGANMACGMCSIGMGGTSAAIMGGCA